MEFVTIDFETATADRHSICSVGIVTFKDNQIVDEYYHLVKPDVEYFDPYNVEINGITEEMVANEPTFAELWAELLPKLQGKQVVAHFAQFDMSVLRNALDHYSIPYPEFNYLCTWVLAKKAINDAISYRLNALARRIKYKFTHHNALEDAKTCGMILLDILKDVNAQSFEEVAQHFSIQCGHIYPEGYRPCSAASNNSTNTALGKIQATETDIDTEHYFYGKNIAFTGTLISMPRKEAVQKIVNKGAVFSPSVTKKTNILVFGYQDPYKFAENAENSAKFIKAQALRAAGADIEIINEDDFIKILES